MKVGFRRPIYINWLVN